VRPVLTVLAFLAACGGGAPAARLPESAGEPGQLADEDRFEPSYDKRALQEALIAERAQEATAERRVAELEPRAIDEAGRDRLRVATADLAVRRRFIASLEACEVSGRWCPPRLDDPVWSYDHDGDRLDAPPVAAPLRFDLASWRVLAAELFGRACACRTRVCVESVSVAIDVLERRPMPEVQGDELASLAITRARECLFRLRGKRR
jgi:hypothetical protein